MPSLADMQRAFAAAVFERGGPPGFAIYRSNIFGNWALALASAYPIVRKIVGAAFFDAMAAQYARAHPSVSGDLNEYGGELAEFVAAFTPTQDLPYLPDVARMEWLAHRAYYARDPRPFTLAGLNGSTRLALAPPCALLASPWPLERIWAVHQDGYEGKIDVDLGAGPDRFLVHRPAWRAQVRSLAAGDYRFLDMARQGCTLGEALEAASAEDACFDPSLALARWIDAVVLTL